MYRRNFIKATSVTMLGLTASKGLFAQTQPQNKFKVFAGDSTDNEDIKPAAKLALTINISVIEALSKASDIDKQVKLSYIELDSEDHETDKKYVGKYVMNNSKNITPADEKSIKIYSVLLVKKAVEQKKCTLPTVVNFDKLKILVTCKLATSAYSIEVLQKNESVFMDLLPAEDKEGCFLTSACVATMCKPDDCYELTALRNFRDNYLITNKEGIELVKEYYKIAPTIVHKINQQSNFREVYADIYNKMILPTIENINNHNPDEAISIYKNYTYKLKKKYCS